MLLHIVGSLYAQSTGTPPGKPIGTIILPAKIRDFKEYNAGGHPDFQNKRGQYKGAVKNIIGTDGRKSIFKMDHRNPVFQARGGPFAGETFFNHWYNDEDTTINRPFLIGLEFTIHDNCILTYLNDYFFPIDDGETFCSFQDPPLRTFGHLQTSFPEHNYGFTMEFHAEFTYIRGANQIFSFKGDDDVWVFINDSLVIDLGGLHAALNASVNLDELRPGFLRDGHKYILDFFSAERHTRASRIRIETSILLNTEFGGIFGKTKAQKGKIINCFGYPVEVRSPKAVCKPVANHQDIANNSHRCLPIARYQNGAITISAAGSSTPGSIFIYSLCGKRIRRLYRTKGNNLSRYNLPSTISPGVYLVYNSNKKQINLGKLTIY